MISLLREYYGNILKFNQSKFINLEPILIYKIQIPPIPYIDFNFINGIIASSYLFYSINISDLKYDYILLENILI